MAFQWRSCMLDCEAGRLTNLEMTKSFAGRKMSPWLSSVCKERSGWFLLQLPSRQSHQTSSQNGSDPEHLDPEMIAQRHPTLLAWLSSCSFGFPCRLCFLIAKLLKTIGRTRQRSFQPWTRWSPYCQECLWQETARQLWSNKDIGY